MIRSIGPRKRPPLSATFLFATGVFVGCGVASGASSATSTPVRSMTIRTTKFAELRRKRNAAIAVANAGNVMPLRKTGAACTNQLTNGPAGLP